ncbi:MAG TPA: polyribonucleotide nucleotidyltransferase [bacterium]|nr:polyribonucleotide nucleotidyltransferase [bacterium]
MAMQKVSMELGGRTLEIETGRVAKQAAGSVWVRYGDTVLLVTICMGKEPKQTDFFPLSVEYREKFFAAGKIPGGFLKREARPRDREVLISRIVDRPMRPLFDKRLRYEVQVMATVLSADEVNMPDAIAVIGGSAAACLSDIPFAGPVGAVIVGIVDGKIVINPTREQMHVSAMELVVAASKDAVVMVEGEAKEVPEDQLIQAIEMAHTEIKKIVALQEELVAKAGKPKRVFQLHSPDPALVAAIEAEALPKLTPVLAIAGKHERGEAMSKVAEEILAPYKAKFADDPVQLNDASDTINGVFKKLLRKTIIEKGVRSDGRGVKDVRPITCELGVLPRTHGSALFTRGETQALATLTLGSKADAQRIDDIIGEGTKHYMLHYNFPQYSVGETGRVGTGRREIGHGNLAERSLLPILPGLDEFPYTIRIVSDITESNGSSSMASVCGGCLALMDGGVPIKKPVAGIAMGLITDGDRHVVLSDILGQEDALGDMDFKVTGTEQGVTAIQMDIKIKGLSFALMREALAQAREGRLHILGIMRQAITTPRQQLSPYAPRIYSMKIPMDKIGTLIGPGGKTIRGLCEEFKVKIDVQEDGVVNIASSDGAALEAARSKVAALVEEVQVGKTYTGPVKKIMDFGAFVEVLPGTDGLVHVSELDRRHVKAVSDILKEGDIVTVKCIGVDKNGKIKLSRKALMEEEGA